MAQLGTPPLRCVIASLGSPRPSLRCSSSPAGVSISLFPCCNLPGHWASVMFKPTLFSAPSPSGAPAARPTFGEIKRQKLMRPWTAQFTKEMNDAEEERCHIKVRNQAYDEGTRAGVRPDLGPFVSLFQRDSQASPTISSQPTARCFSRRAVDSSCQYES